MYSNNKKRVLILGAGGMLGSEVVRYLTPFHNVVASTRKTFDITKDSIFDYVRKINPDYVINCAGAIKQKVYNPWLLYRINSVFPRELAKINKYNGWNTKVIHVSTDCVFDGKKGEYTEHSIHNATDDYGQSKSLGEFPEQCIVIRTSIIGEDPNSNSSLLEWVRSHKGSSLYGYQNHFWNGMTTTTLANIFHEIITSETNIETGLYHLHSDTVSKDELVRMIVDVYELPIEVESTIAIPINRTLRTINPLILDHNYKIPTIKFQLKQHKERNDNKTNKTV